MNDFTELASKVFQLAQELDSLSVTGADGVEDLRADVHPALEPLCDRLDSTIMALTREAAASLDSKCERMLQLEHFIRFRNACIALDDRSLRQIIDSETVSPDLAFRLCDLFPNEAAMMKHFEDLRQEWRASFPGKRYGDLSDRFIPH